MARKPESLFDSFKNRSRSSSRSDLNLGSNNKTVMDDLIKQVYYLNKRVSDLEKLVYDLQQKNAELTSKLSDSVVELNNNGKNLVDKVDALNVFLNVPKLSIWARLKSSLLYRPTIEVLKRKKIYKNEPCFNTELESVLRDPSSGVPKIVLNCCCLIEKTLFECRFHQDTSSDEDHLMEPAKMISGIYRAPGDCIETQKLRFKINDNKYECLEKVENVHTIASLVKLFFFELKTPLIRDIDILNSEEIKPEVFCNDQIDVRIIALKSFLEKFPEIYYVTLKFFILHLTRLIREHGDLVSSRSFSISIGPSVIRVDKYHENIEERCKYQELMNDYLYHIIEFSDYIFPRTVIRTTDV